MHLPLKKKFLLRQAFNSYCPVGSLVFTRKTRVQLLQQHCPALVWHCPPAHTQLSSAMGGLQSFNMLLGALLFFHPKEEQSTQWKKNTFHVAFYSIQRQEYEYVTMVHELTFLISLMKALLKTHSGIL